MTNELARLTWPEAQALIAKDPVAFVPIGSTEPHGPHLALDTDVTIAVAQTREACRRLEERGVPTLVAPPVAYGLTNFTDGFAGRVTIRPGTLFNLLEDICEGLGQEGVSRIVLSNAHLEPGHIEVIRSLVTDFAGPSDERCRDKPHVIFPDNTRRRWAGTLGDEFLSGECHAGSYEASIVLAADPDAVRLNELRALPPVEIGLMEGMRAGKRSFKEMGSDAAYCGDPAAASAEEGQESIGRLADMLVTSILETWPELGT